MKWTTDKPTKPGWYWAKIAPWAWQKETTEEIIRVIITYGGNPQALIGDELYDIPHLCLRGLAGPIPLPED
jgi:hypothetical protein